MATSLSEIVSRIRHRLVAHRNPDVSGECEFDEAQRRMGEKKFFWWIDNRLRAGYYPAELETLIREYYFLLR